MNKCSHSVVKCLNQYELIRKYICPDCGHVMICSCDEKIGTTFLPHQLDYGTVLETQENIKVTLGFQSKICRECRGLVPEAHPVAEIYGRGSKIMRYYWRELSFREKEIFAEWANSKGLSPGDTYLAPDKKYAQEVSEIINRARKQALEEIKQLHKNSPKYQFKEESQIEIIKKYEVKVINLHATYIKNPNSRKTKILDSDDSLTVEEYVGNYFRKKGFEIVELESRPFHVLFGVYMWLVIQDPADTRNRMSGFGRRSEYKPGENTEMIWTFLPDDFGSPGYAKRRSSAIKEHLSPDLLDRGNLEWTFDYWLDHSEDFREYLWAHQNEDIVKARKLIQILPPEKVVEILKYLVEHYWGRYLGWPDLLVHNNQEFFFVEVKSSNDKLSEDQKSWIKGNYEVLKLPFKIVKVHRSKTIELD